MERKLKIRNSRNQENFFLCEFLRSKFNLFCFFLVFAVNFGSGLPGLGTIQIKKGSRQNAGCPLL